ncbi:hypothetical protein MIN45_P1618 [Methylomarinovum tepidoasis]|uniref:Nitroreductase domain-containing protein n=1 Tax=Methylomarinovum tepidoasis TaxID=2840183 RepID=A0AAU9CBE6_9GAMM|nr:hypothetical protein MIN45_P1618 [Methylomarinovum sp. IN45]
MSRERLNVQAPVHELIAARWSPRAFDARPVETEKLASCLEAARWAPSCYNDQPWRFLVADRHQEGEAWQRLFDCLSPGNQTWARRAPVLILACAATRFGHNGQPNRWAQYDTGQAMMSLVLQAIALGLAAHQMGGFDAGRVRQAFAIPDEYDLMSVAALGYPGDPAVLDEETRQRELASHQRKPLEEIAFAGRRGLGFMVPDSLGWKAKVGQSACPGTIRISIRTWLKPWSGLGSRAGGCSTWAPAPAPRRCPWPGGAFRWWPPMSLRPRWIGPGGWRSGKGWR